MRVRRTSWNYRLWKQWHSEYNEPTNLCSYFWFSMFQWTAGWVVIAAVFSLVGVSAAVAWFFGFRLNLRMEAACLLHDYKYDLYNWKIRGRRYAAAPWQVISTLFFLYVLAAHWRAIIHGSSTLFSAIPKEVVYESLELVGMIAAMVLFAVGLFCLFQNELVRSYLRAAKEKVCPRIELVD